MPKLSDQARADRIARIRQEQTVGTVDAAIFLNVSKRTLERWRDQEGVGPAFIPPVVPPGANRTTQHYKYRVSVLEDWQKSRESLGGFYGMSFATNTAWAMNDQGQIMGDAFTLYSATELDRAIDEDRVDVMTLPEALELRWSSVDAMQAYVDELNAGLEVIKGCALRALEAQTMFDKGVEPIAPSRPLVRP